MHRRYGTMLIALALLTALLTACGGSKATATPQPTTTTAPTTAPTSAAASSSATAATRPAGSAVTAGSSVAGTTAASPAALATRPAGSVVTSPSSIAGTRPAGSVTVGSVTAGTTTASGSAAAGGALTVFTDQRGRFTFSRPAAWTVGQSTGSQTVVQFNSADPLGVVDISTEPAPPGITLDTLLALAITEVKKTIPDAQQVGTLPLRLGGEQAMQIDYTGTVSGNKIYFSQIYAIHSGTTYVLTLGAQPADIDRMKQQAIVVVQTWKFLQ